MNDLNFFFHCNVQRRLSTAVAVPNGKGDLRLNDDRPLWNVAFELPKWTVKAKRLQIHLVVFLKFAITFSPTVEAVWDSVSPKNGEQINCSRIRRSFVKSRKLNVQPAVKVKISTIYSVVFRFNYFLSTRRCRIQFHREADKIIVQEPAVLC